MVGGALRWRTRREPIVSALTGALDRVSGKQQTAAAAARLVEGNRAGFLQPVDGGRR